MRPLVKFHVPLATLYFSLLALSESVQNGQKIHEVNTTELTNSFVSHNSHQKKELHPTNKGLERRSDELFLSVPGALNNLPPSIIDFSHYLHPFVPGVWKLPSEIYQRVIKINPQAIEQPQPALVESKSFITNPKLSSIRMNYVIADNKKLIPITQIEKRQHLPYGSNIFYGIESRNPHSEEVSTESDYGKFLNDDYRAEIEKQAEAFIKNKFKNTKSTKVLEPVTSKEQAPEPLKIEPHYEKETNSKSGHRHVNQNNDYKNKHSDHNNVQYGYDSYSNEEGKEINQNTLNDGRSSYEQEEPNYNGYRPEHGQQYENHGYNKLHSYESDNEQPGYDHNPPYNYFDQNKYGSYIFSGESFSPHYPASYEEYRSRYFNLPNYILLSDEDTNYNLNEHHNQPRNPDYYYNPGYRKSKSSNKKRLCSEKPKTSSSGTKEHKQNKPQSSYPPLNYQTNRESSQEIIQNDQVQDPKMNLLPEKIQHEYKHPETQYNSYKRQHEPKSITYEHLLSSFENNKPRNSYSHEIQKIPTDYYSNEINDISANQPKPRVVTSSPITVQTRIPDSRTKTNPTKSYDIKNENDQKKSKRKQRRSPRKKHKQKRSNRGKEDLRVAATTNQDDENSKENDKGNFFMYKVAPHKQFFEMGYRLGGPEQIQEKHHISDGAHSKIKINWKDQNGDEGEQYWEFNHDSAEGNDES